MSDTDQPADDTGGTEPGAESAAEPSADQAALDDTEAVFADAFAPPGGDGAPSPEDYESAVRVMGLEDNESDKGDRNEEIPHSDQADDDTDDDEPPSRREARYRVKLRDTEARLQAAADENAALHDQLDAMRSAQAVTLAAGRLADPKGDLFREHNVDDVCAPDGSVDAAKVDALCASLVEQHPHWGVARPVVNPHALRSGARKADEAPVPSWQRAFAPRPK